MDAANPLSILLFLYGSINIFNGLVVMTLWVKNRRSEYKYLFLFFAGSILCIVIQGVTANFGNLAVIAGGAAQFLVSVPSAYFIGTITKYQVSARKYYSLFFGGLLMGFLVSMVSENFFWIAFPVMIGTAYPYFDAVAGHYRSFKSFSLIGKTLFVIYGVFFLHMLDFSILRDKEEFQVIGFSTGLLLVFLQTIFSLALAIETISKKEKIKLEYMVAARTRLLEFKNNEILKQQRSIEHKNEELLRLNDEKNNLIGIVAHDLKSPLNQVEGLLNLISMELDNVDDDLIDTARGIITRQRAMINRILDIQAIEASITHVEKIDIEIVHLVRSIVRSYSKSATTKNLRLMFTTDEPDAILHTNQGYLVMIVENLLSNAIKFSPPNRQINISIKKGEQLEGVCLFRIEVADEGPGIPHHEMGMLFKRFQRLSSRPTAGEESTGLGLAIAKKYCDTLGGEIWCERNSAGGSTFITAFKQEVSPLRSVG